MDLKKALTTLAPDIERQYVELVRQQAGEALERFGWSLTGMQNDPVWGRRSAEVRGNMLRITAGDPFTGAWEVDEPRLERNARVHARDLVRDWAAKLQGKMAPLSNVDIKRGAGLELVIAGSKERRK